MMASATVQQKKEYTYTGIPTAKVLLWLGIVSMIMAFGGLTSAYIVRKAEGNWFQFQLPKTFLLSTILIILSSFTIQFAYWSAKKNNLVNAKTGMLATLALGLGFVFCQFYSWNVLVANGIFFVGNPSGSFVYVFSGLHLAHLAGGIIALIVVSAKTILEKYNSENYQGIQLCSIYWHFLDLLWVYLFVFISYLA
jgi:cytochrome c oxidase subunit 3